MYNYSKQKQKLSTESGQRMLAEIKSNADQLLKGAGAFRMDMAINGCIGDVWTMMACVDYLVESGEIREITSQKSVFGQHRVFVSKSNIKQLR